MILQVLNYKTKHRFQSVGPIFRDPQGHGTPWAPYYSHIFPNPTPIRIPKDMGMVWEAYHKGVPLLGVPGITLDSGTPSPIPCFGEGSRFLPQKPLPPSR